MADKSAADVARACGAFATLLLESSTHQAGCAYLHGSEVCDCGWSKAMAELCEAMERWADERELAAGEKVREAVIEICEREEPYPEDIRALDLAKILGGDDD